MSPGTRTDPGDPRPVVMVVDDDDVLRLMACEALRLAGVDVVEAADGVDAIALFEEKRPALVLLDVVMPRMDGLAACAAIRGLAGGEDTPVVIMTSLNDMASIERAFEVGATDFVTKPINYDVLRHRVRYMLRAHEVAVLRRGEERLKVPQRITRLDNWEWDARTDVFKLSDELLDVLGVSADTLFERYGDVQPVAHPDDKEHGDATPTATRQPGQPLSIEHRLQFADGSVRVLRQEATLVHEAEASRRWVGTVQDITGRNAAEQMIVKLVYFDTVTDLPNRVMLYKKLGAALENRPADAQVAVLALDLDMFKRVNDALGHGAGDQVLRGVAERVRASMPDSTATRGIPWMDPRDGRCDASLVTRVGADEFVVLLPSVPDSAYARSLANRVIEAVSEPFEVCGTTVVLSASIGIAMSPSDGEDTETLLRNADAALYHAKSEGRGRVEMFRESITARTRSRIALEDDLRAALRRSEFEVYYQPKVTADGEEVVGAEALIRWKHPQRGHVPPLAFIPVAEETGLIGPMGEWVLRTALAQSAAWARGLVGPLGMAVNVSTRQFRHRSLAQTVLQIVSETGVDPRRLELELTESALLDENTDIVVALSKLRAAGIRVALDDFGTGCSSLSLLKKIPIDLLKIDRTFVSDVLASRDSAGITSAIIALGRSLSLTVVAEGVETREQRDFLRAHRCDELQGYLYSPPLPAADFEHWVLRRRESLAGPRLARRSWTSPGQSSRFPAGA